ncbi:MAG: DUF512 domain-containing protein [Lachnospiraceae bacterium]|nr:DUF512 domain-containing protein [Lachnospiraceae bacterium]
MEKDRSHIIKEVKPGSIAEEMELEAGDKLISINGHELEDIFDYHYFANDDYLIVLVEKANGEEWELEIEKDFDEDLGIIFENGLMDDYKSCSNKCVFCFIDQMPPGMRETLYFKDDDSRLSFLQGNYITLTNMKDKDMERIIRYHLAPINISVHTTNPQLRCEMLHNRFAGEALKKIDVFYEHEIEMNGQVVLCKGINDGAELDRTIGDLTKYMPYMRSLSIVPVGLTKYREGLAKLEPFEKEDAIEVIGIIEKWQRYCMEKFGMHFVQASDEWYLTAGLPMPEAERYDGYIQLENGVGMMRLLEEEFNEALANDSFESQIEHHQIEHHITIATGRLAAPLLEKLSACFMEKHPNYHVDVVPIRNDFFGERITVSGLITAQDLVAQLKEHGVGERLLLPCNMLRIDEEVFLDDWTLTDVKNALQVETTIVKSSGLDLLQALLGVNE